MPMCMRARAVIDFGFQYEVGKANTRFAVGVSNFGFNTEPSGAVEVFSVGGAVDTVSDFEKIAVPAVFRIGIAWDALKKTDHLLSIAGQLNHPTDNNETYGSAPNMRGSSCSMRGPAMNSDWMKQEYQTSDSDFASNATSVCCNLITDFRTRANWEPFTGLLLESVFFK